MFLLNNFCQVVVNEVLPLKDNEIFQCVVELLLFGDDFPRIVFTPLEVVNKLFSMKAIRCHYKPLCFSPGLGWIPIPNR